MALTQVDLDAIEQIVDRKVAPIHTDIKELRADVLEMKKDAKELRVDVSEMKKDLRILARIAQLDLIKQEKRLNYLTED